MKNIVIFIVLVSAFQNCRNSSTPIQSHNASNKVEANDIRNPQAISFLGSKLSSPIPSEKITNQWLKKKNAFEENPEVLDNIIWHGRFTAYKGDYIKALEIYTEGIRLYPDEPRLYRHRGHRFITLRKIDEAIGDFKKAEELIEGTNNTIEPDGMPNAQNIPVSTLHGNIYYHLGLAYYLKDDLPNALSSFQQCLNTSSNADNVVSASHWIYMIMRRLNMDSKAAQLLEGISSEMNIIENHSYFDLCQFYKNQKSEKELINPDGAASANDAVKYGIANWYLYNDEPNKGRSLLNEIVGQSSWASFGFIAAEADLSRM